VPHGRVRTPPVAWGATPAGRPAVDAVTGSRIFPTDVTRPGMLHGMVLRPPAHGAVLRSVDVKGAEAIEHVRVVRDGSFIGVVASDPWTTRPPIDSIRAEREVTERSTHDHLAAHL